MITRFINTEIEFFENLGIDNASFEYTGTSVQEDPLYGDVRYFDGTDDFIRVLGSANLTFESDKSFTIGGRIKVPAGFAPGMLLSKITDDVNNYGFVVRYDGLTITLIGDGDTQIVESEDVPKEEWVDFVIVYGLTESQIYINNVLNPGASSSVSVTANTEDILIGKSPTTPSELFEGQIKEIFIDSDRAWSEEEVADYHNNISFDHMNYLYNNYYANGDPLNFENVTEEIALNIGFNLKSDGSSLGLSHTQRKDFLNTYRGYVSVDVFSTLIQNLSGNTGDEITDTLSPKQVNPSPVPVNIPKIQFDGIVDIAITDFVPVSDTNWEIHAAFLDPEATTLAGGIYDAGCHFNIGVSSGEWSVGYGILSRDFGTADSLPHWFKLDGNKFYIDGNLEYTMNETWTSNSLPMYVGGINQNGGAAYRMEMEIYEMKLNGETVYTAEEKTGSLLFSKSSSVIGDATITASSINTVRALRVDEISCDNLENGFTEPSQIVLNYNFTTDTVWSKEEATSIDTETGQLVMIPSTGDEYEGGAYQSVPLIIVGEWYTIEIKVDEFTVPIDAFFIAWDEEGFEVPQSPGTYTYNVQAETTERFTGISAYSEVGAGGSIKVDYLSITKMGRRPADPLDPVNDIDGNALTNGPNMVQNGACDIVQTDGRIIDALDTINETHGADFIPVAGIFLGHPYWRTENFNNTGYWVQVAWDGAGWAVSAEDPAFVAFNFTISDLPPNVAGGWSGWSKFYYNSFFVDNSNWLFIELSLANFEARTNTTLHQTDVWENGCVKSVKITSQENN